MAASTSTDAQSDPAAQVGCPSLEAGMRVRVSQQISQQGKTWVTNLEGTIVQFGQSKTGSWFAHSKDDRFWLDRLEIQKDDGERTVCNLDQFSRIELLAAAPLSTDDADDSAAEG